MFTVKCQIWLFCILDTSVKHFFFIVLKFNMENPLKFSAGSENITLDNFN